MPRNTKFSLDEKIKAVKSYLDGNSSLYQITKELDVALKTVQMWVSNFQSMGEEGLATPKQNSYYSKELKLSAVNDYLSGSYSQLDVCKKYKIRSESQLRTWIFKHNNHEEFKSCNSGGTILMNKGRSTTLDERVKIVNDCIENNKDYTKSAEKYTVSYQQVRNWVSKYENKGIDGLIDKRGIKKLYIELDDVERLKLENKLLQTQNKKLEIQNEFLKKLAEVERSW